TAERREALFQAVVESAAQVAVVVIPAVQIDRRGLHRSNLSALGRALCALDPEPDVCMTDGFSVPGCVRAHRAVVGGDGRSAAIAAASIVAKHTRAVHEHGPTPLHRRSFEAIAYAQMDLDLGL